MTRPAAEKPAFGDDLALVIRDDPVLAEWWRIRQRELSWATFKPRPDRPEQFDQQAGFCFHRDKVAFLIGGNAAGTTEAAAYKTALFLLRQQPPPRKDAPFWIIANTYDQVCDVCWTEKLLGHGHIPECEIEWDRIAWHSAKKEQPASVPLKPWPVERAREVWEAAEHTRAKPAPPPDANWLIEFKSYEQGRRSMQARSIGGFWFSEQFPLELFLEVFRGCREYMFPGGQFAEFTPIEPELCLWVEKAIEQAATDPKFTGWEFYRANTECNKENLAAGWFEQFFGTVGDEMLATRMTGALATFEGVIYQSFNPAVHVLDDEPADVRLKNPDKLYFPELVENPPKNVWHFRGLDWGASEEHPFACVWGFRDGAGDWWIYDEYWNNRQDAITSDHIQEILNRWPWPEGSPWHGPTFADPSRPGEINAFNAGGINTQPAGNDVYKGIDLVRSLLKINPRTRRPRLFISKKRCQHLVDELRKYRWLKGKKSAGGSILNPKVAQPVPLKRDDDTVDALRYLLYSAHAREGAVPGSTQFSRDTAKRSGLQLDRSGAGASAQQPIRGPGGGWFHRTKQ